MKFISLLVLVLASGFATGASLTREYTIPAPRLDDGKLVFKGGVIAPSMYAPSVAIKPVKLLLPKGHRAVRSRVSYHGLTQLKGSFSVKPNSPSYNNTIGPPAMPLLKASKAYGINADFPPQQTIPSISTQYKNGHAIAVGVTQPLQYNPVTKSARYFSRMRVTVETEPDPAAPAVKTTPAIIARLAGLVDNPQAVAAAPTRPTPVGADDFEYLIICTPILAGGFEEFVAFNKRRGMRTQIMTTDEAFQYQGRDPAEKVRNAIKDKYENNNIHYVLLAGDDDRTNPTDVPHRGMHVEMYDHKVTPDRYSEDFNIPADLYFSSLDGDWLTDNTTGIVNDYFGEYGTEDWFADVYASRFVVDNLEQLQNVIKKTIAYSESPVKDKIKNTSFFGEYKWDNPEDGTPIWGKDHLETFIGISSAYFGPTHGIPTNWNIEMLMEKDRGDYGFDAIIQTLVQNEPSFVNHTGHANSSYNMKTDVGRISNSTFADFDGRDKNYFILNSSSCQAGSFDNMKTNGDYGDDSWSEVVHRLPNGPVLILSNSRTGYGDDDAGNGPSQRPQRYVLDALFNPEKKIHHFQEMLSHSVEANVDILSDADFVNSAPYFGSIKWCVFTSNSMGDPALSMWTDTPQELSPTMAFAGSAFELNPNPGPYTWIALADASGNIICTQQTGREAIAQIQNDVLTDFIHANLSSTMKVMIKAHNFMPYEGSVAIPATEVYRQLPKDIGFTARVNPASEKLTANYTLARQSYVNLGIYNSRGILMTTLAKGSQSAGKYTFSYDVDGVDKGIYYCRFRAGDQQEVSKIVVTQ